MSQPASHLHLPRVTTKIPSKFMIHSVQYYIGIVSFDQMRFLIETFHSLRISGAIDLIHWQTLEIWFYFKKTSLQLWLTLSLFSPATIHQGIVIGGARKQNSLYIFTSFSISCDSNVKRFLFLQESTGCPKKCPFARWLKLGFFEYNVFLHGYYEEDLPIFGSTKS